MPEPSHSGYRKDPGVGGDADSHPETPTDAVARLAGLLPPWTCRRTRNQKAREALSCNTVGTAVTCQSKSET